MARRHGQTNLQSKLSAVALCSVFAAAAIVSGPAQAGGFFDFLFGGPDKGPHPSVSSYADPQAPVTPPVPLGQESVRQSGGSTGHGVAFCVRLCDGQHFPLEQRVANATPVETCRSMCPASKTKVFFGSEIDHAVAKDGARYADLDTAYIYRKQLVANCTCNGKNALGLAPYDLPTDPTLRPGDIVATKQGLMAYNGNKDVASQYTPVSVPSVATQLNSVTSARSALNRHDADTAEDDPGTIAQSQPAPQPPLSIGDKQGPVDLRWPSIQ
ncbi:MAG TPA: DUF2865 domain-containing protein [Xanthobacteraceae bacterium]|jgi:hypothetical protein|nr:DUF2865 domain-containing protein [Xanthobacteraceae bacterium]